MRACVGGWVGGCACVFSAACFFPSLRCAVWSSVSLLLLLKAARAKCKMPPLASATAATAAAAAAVGRGLRKRRRTPLLLPPDGNGDDDATGADKQKQQHQRALFSAADAVGECPFCGFGGNTAADNRCFMCDGPTARLLAVRAESSQVAHI
jgi:hypothetical protein